MELLTFQELSGDYVALSSTLGVTKNWWDKAAYYQREEARALAIGRSMTRAVLVGSAAARIHGLWVFRPREGTEDILLALPSGARPPRYDWPVGCRYIRADVRVVDVVRGVRVTTRAQTVVDIARWNGWIRGFVAAESLLYRGDCPDDLTHACKEGGRVRGITDARKAIELARGLSESPYEALAYALLVFAKLPVRQQVYLVESFRVDLLVGESLVVEIDGAVKYDGVTYGVAVAEVILAERRREIKLQNAGFTVLRFMAAEIERDPEGFIHAVRRKYLAMCGS